MKNLQKNSACKPRCEAEQLDDLHVVPIKEHSSKIGATMQEMTTTPRVASTLGSNFLELAWSDATMTYRYRIKSNTIW